ncbi:hypothetical protein PO124_27190 [Bacillus licheniformis]|nr:hypothetical protein [Bacillus licheniformis]
MTSHLDEYLSACQLGITVTALGLGWLGEPTMQTLLHPLSQNRLERVDYTYSFILAAFYQLLISMLSSESWRQNDRHSKAETVTLLLHSR